jgi:hypothetical protein
LQSYRSALASRRRLSPFSPLLILSLLTLPGHGSVFSRIDRLRVASPGTTGRRAPGRHTAPRGQRFIHSQDFRSMFPNIFVVARSVLCLVPASCQPESVFSTTRWTLGTYCHNLGPGATEARVILHRVAQEFDSVVDASRHAMRQAGSAGCEPHSSQTTPLRAGVSRAGVRPPPSDLPGLDCM